MLLCVILVNKYHPNINLLLSICMVVLAGNPKCCKQKFIHTNRNIDLSISVYHMRQRFLQNKLSAY